MFNKQFIMWVYKNFGLATAIKSVCYDIIAILGFMGYCLTLPFRFLVILWRGWTKERL
jgi:hypothetical protein